MARRTRGPVRLLGSVLGAVPAGTWVVGVGLVAGGVCTYAFLTITARALGPDRYAPFAAFWSLLVVGGPGLFIPLEQELGRAIAVRRTLGQGSRPLVATAARGASLLVLVLGICITLAVGPLADHAFRGMRILVVALGAGLAVYAIEYLARGMLAGQARFRAYAVLAGGEGGLRAAIAGGLALFGTHVAGSYAFAVVIGSLGAVALSLTGRRGLMRPGPSTSFAELSRAIGLLLVATTMLEVLISIGTLSIQVLADPTQQSAASRYLSSRAIAFIPLFVFTAVNITLLPRLSALAADARWRQFRHVLLRLVALAALFGGSAAVGVALLGPVAVSVLFGSGFQLGHFDFAVIGSTCAVIMVAQVLGGGHVALRRYGRVALSWTVGVVIFVCVTAIGSQLFVRVETGLLAGAVASMLCMAALLVTPMRHPLAVATGEPSFAATPILNENR